MGCTKLGQPQSRAVVFAGSLGGGMRRPHVASVKSVVDSPAETTIHAVSMAMAAVFGNSIYFADGVGSAELDRPVGPLCGQPVRNHFSRATFPAALVGSSRRS